MTHSLIKQAQPMIVERVKLGMEPKAAALASGIAVDTFNEWKGRANGTGHGRGDPDGIYARFLQELEQAEAIAVERCLKSIRQAAQNPNGSGWGAAKWLLSKLDAARYGDRIEVSGSIEHRKVYRFEAPSIPELTEPTEVEVLPAVEEATDDG